MKTHTNANHSVELQLDGNVHLNLTTPSWWKKHWNEGREA